MCKMYVSILSLCLSHSSYARPASPPAERTVTVDNYYNNMHEKTATVTYKVATKNVVANQGGRHQRPYTEPYSHHMAHAHERGGQNLL